AVIPRWVPAVIIVEVDRGQRAVLDRAITRPVMGEGVGLYAAAVLHDQAFVGSGASRGRNRWDDAGRTWRRVDRDGPKPSGLVEVPAPRAEITAGMPSSPVFVQSLLVGGGERRIPAILFAVRAVRIVFGQISRVADCHIIVQRGG